MDKRIKFLLLLLGAVSLLAIALTVWIYLSAQSEIQGYIGKHAKLEKENTSLQQSLDTAKKETRLWKDKSESITETLNKLSREHTLLAGQYDSLLTDKQTLLERTKSLSEELAELKKLYSQAQEQPKMPEEEDSFFASLLKQKAALEVEVESLKRDIAYGEEKIRQLEEQSQPISLLQGEKQILEQSLREANRVADILSKDLVAERKRNGALEREMARLEEKFAGVVAQRDELSGQLTKMKLLLQQRIEELGESKRLLEKTMEQTIQPRSATQTTSAAAALIQLAPIVVRAETEKADFSAQEAQKIPAKAYPKTIEKASEKRGNLPAAGGRIVTVNETHKFVVIDIGQVDGLKEGMSFGVYRQAEKIGQIEVIETRKNIAACDIKQKSVRDLRVGDTVLADF